MLTISKPLSAGQAQAYHAEEFGNARENYYTEGEQIAASGTASLPSTGDSRRSARRKHFSGSAKASIPSQASNWCGTRRRANT